MTKDFRKALRHKAEALLDRLPKSIDDIDKKDIRNLIEELSVHQIELELQNEELVAAQTQLEKSRLHYISLFNSAAVGYVILDSVGIIRQANATFMEMVPEFMTRKTGQAFADFLSEDDAEVFRARFKSMLKSPQGKRVEARLRTGRNRFRYVQLEAKKNMVQAALHDDSQCELWLTVTDIHDLTQTKCQLQTALSDIRQLKRLLPICSHCKRIRDDQGYWNQLEAYIQKHSDLEFSHSICQECAKKYYPGMDIYDE